MLLPVRMNIDRTHHWTLGVVRADAKEWFHLPAPLLCANAIQILRDDSGLISGIYQREWHEPIEDEE